jgi:hypothetical protein
VIKLWRILLRVQRATFAEVVVVMRSDGKVLLRRHPSGRLELPHQAVDAWIPIETQLDGWLTELRYEKSAPSLSVEGTPGVEGVTFLYTAEIEAAQAAKSGELWLDYEAARVALSAAERGFLGLCASGATRS